ASSLITPPAGRMIGASPFCRPSRASTSSRASMHATTATRLDGLIGCFPGYEALCSVSPLDYYRLFSRQRLLIKLAMDPPEAPGTRSNVRGADSRRALRRY